jgi:hypothetical protein
MSAYQGRAHRPGRPGPGLPNSALVHCSGIVSGLCGRKHLKTVTSGLSLLNLPKAWIPAKSPKRISWLSLRFRHQSLTLQCEDLLWGRVMSLAVPTNILGCES